MSDVESRYGLWVRVVSAFRDVAVSDYERLCASCAKLFPRGGIGISLISDDGAPAVWYGGSDAAVSLERLQFMLGVGPAPDAIHSGAAIFEPDLVHDSPDRWIDYARYALEAKIRAVYSLPLRLSSGASVFGAMTVYQEQPNSLDRRLLAIANIASVFVAEILIAWKAQEVDERWSGMLFENEEVHQAVGVVAIQLAVEASEALVRLRAWAFANDEPIVDVASAVISGRLRLTP